MAGNTLVNLPASFSDFDIWEINLAYESIQSQMTVLGLGLDFGNGIMAAHTESSNFDWVVFRKPIMGF